jgi:hypothetical protein
MSLPDALATCFDCGPFGRARVQDREMQETLRLGSEALDYDIPLGFYLILESEECRSVVRKFFDRFMHICQRGMSLLLFESCVGSRLPAFG